MVERQIFNLKVAGSIPAGLTEWFFDLITCSRTLVVRKILMV